MTNRSTQHFAAIFCRPVMWERASPFVWPFVHKPHDTGLLLKSSNSVHFDAEFPKPAVKIPLLPPKGMMKTFDSFVRHSARYSPAVHFGLLLAAHPSPSWPQPGIDNCPVGLVKNAPTELWKFVEIVWLHDAQMAGAKTSGDASKAQCLHTLPDP